MVACPECGAGLNRLVGPDAAVIDLCITDHGRLLPRPRLAVIYSCPRCEFITDTKPTGA